MREAVRLTGLVVCFESTTPASAVVAAAAGLEPLPLLTVITDMVGAAVRAGCTPSAAGPQPVLVVVVVLRLAEVPAGCAPIDSTLP